ncbi:hypothetical protein [Leptospira kirschneri]|uniref:hypothetical protein n=1 Tax=Leptospira kirschneri TaxID=29507 RepID=UPI00029299EB|nr:hypothetical protein [Leptospira kirschneri]EKO62288.1 hypothetical protein LEP1GSC082_4585 [Leptospira kirschneri str. H2]
MFGVPPDSIVLCKSTTQTIYYDECGTRENHVIHDFGDKFTEFGFTQKCLLDFTVPPMQRDLTRIQKLIDEDIIEKKGILDSETLKSIYNKIRDNKTFYSNKEIHYIQDSLNNIGIQGLQAPKSNNSRKKR